MNKTKKIAFGIGIVLAVLVAFTASAAADNIGRFDPQHGSADTDEYVPVIVYADIEAGSDLAGSGFTLKFDPDHIDIYSIDFACDDNDPTGPGQYCWGSLDVNATYKENGYIWAFTSDPLESVYVAVPPPAHWEWQSIIYHGIEGPLENVEMYRVWVHPQSDDTPGVSPFEFGFEMFPGGCPICQQTQWINWTGYTVPTTFINGTFTHEGVGPPEVDNKTIAETSVSGTPSGNHTFTHNSDNVYESIEEEAITTGKPKNRLSYLEHIWTIDVISGTKTNVTFHLEANHTVNDENDHFVFAYSIDNISYTDMVTVYNMDDNNEYQIYKLPNETSGIVYIRVMDTDRTGGNNDPDTIYIDHMYIRSVLGPPDETPPVITNVTNTVPTHNSATIEWDTDEPADSLVKYGTATGSYTMNEGDATSVTSHSIELTGLESNTTYYYVVNSTDPSGNSNESAEYSFTTESQPSMPDLEITDIWCQYVRKNTYDIYYNITNNGGVEAGRSDSNWTVDGVDEGTDKVASLAPGQVSTEKFTYRGSAPNTVKMCADYNSKIDESDETNNCMEKTVTCT